MSLAPFPHDASIVLPKLTQKNLESGRVYLVEDGAHKGAAYPSITRVLGAKPKPQLIAWRKRVGPAKAAAISKRATTQGTGFHTLAERFLNNETDLGKPLPNVMELWQYTRPWLQKNITCVYRQEADVFSHKLAVAGRFDLLADVCGELAVVDFKTSTKEKKEEWVEDYLLQGTFYSLSVYELTQRKVKRIVILVAHPDGLQVFETKPMVHFDKLYYRINEYYEKYA